MVKHREKRKETGKIAKDYSVIKSIFLMNACCDLGTLDTSPTKNPKHTEMEGSTKPQKSEADNLTDQKSEFCTTKLCFKEDQLF